MCLKINTFSNTHSVTSNAVAEALKGKMNNTSPTISASQVDNISDTEIGVYKVLKYNIGWVSADGFIINIPWSDMYGFQIALDDQSNWVAVRSKSQGTWNAWERLYQGFKLNAIDNFTFTVASGYTVSAVSIATTNYYCGGINVFQLRINNISGGSIGTTSTNLIGTCNLRPKQEVVTIGMDYVSGRPCRLSINENGVIFILESLGVTAGNNIILGVFTMIF